MYASVPRSPRPVLGESFFTWLSLLALLSASCAPDWEEWLARSGEQQMVGLVPQEMDGRVLRSVQFHLDAGEQPRLFPGRLSSAQIANVRREEVSKALQEAEVPLWEVPSASDAEALSARVDASAGPVEGPGADVRHTVAWSALHLLAEDTTYSLVSESQHAVFTTSAGDAVLERVWPRGGHSVRGALYCARPPDANDAPAASPTALWSSRAVVFTADANDAEMIDDAAMSRGSPPVDVLEPSADRAWHALEGDTASDGSAMCWLWAPNAGMPSISPPRIGSLSVEPTVVGVEASGPVIPLICAPHEVSIATGCVDVLDDRLHIRPPEAESLWLVRREAQVDGADSGSAVAAEPTDGGGAWFASTATATGVVKGLSPETDYRLQWSIFYASSATSSGEVGLRTRGALPHLVINEVMADPAGPEPDQEWVELYNDGSQPVNLAGWTLVDEQDAVALPAYEVAPSGYLLLVNDTYSSIAGLDVVPDADAALLYLPRLGKSGLANSGEALRLVDESRMVVSTFPATPKPLSGVSVARRAPWLTGADVGAFALHAAGGASPGAPNRTAR